MLYLIQLDPDEILGQMPYNNLATPDALAVSAQNIYAAGSDVAASPMVQASGDGEKWYSTSQTERVTQSTQITSLRWLSPCRKNSNGVGIGIVDEDGNVIVFPPGSPGQVLVPNPDPDGPPVTWKTEIKNNFSATTDPTVNDDDFDGYSAGSLWINVVTPAVFICSSSSAGAATWLQLY